MDAPDDQPPLNYRRPSPPDAKSAARFERNGWIGMGITLAICTIAAIFFLGRR